VNGPGPPGGIGLDLRAARRAHTRASGGYDRFAVLQAEVRGQLLERLALTALDPAVVLDAGCGTGHASRALQRRYPRSRVIALDVAPGMLRAARAQAGWLRPFDRVCADAGRLPLATGRIDLVFCNLLAHWCEPPALFAEVRRVLAPRGLFTFTCLGPDSLQELRSAWAAVDDGAHVHVFRDMHDLGDELVRAGFAAPVLDVERYTLQYRELAALVADLRGSGAVNAREDRPKGLTGKGKLARLGAAYEVFRTAGRLPATVEVVFGQAWTPATPGREAQGERGTAGISLAALRAKLPGKRRE
jgi:malonyl-CoA O-methyltransferase